MEFDHAARTAVMVKLEDELNNPDRLPGDGGDGGDNYTVLS
jgi:hypothetical protein